MFKQKIKAEVKQRQLAYTMELVQAITDCNYARFKQIMEGNSSLIIWSFQNDAGDTLLHIACRATKFKVAAVKEKFCLPLINKLGKGFLNIRNKANKLPHELIGGQSRIGTMLDNVPSYDGSVDEVLLGERNYRISQQISLNEGRLYRAEPEVKPTKPFPGLYFTDHLDIVFDRLELPANCVIPDRWPELNAIDEMEQFSLHQRLAMSCLLFRKSGTDRNQVTANLGFIVYNKNTQETFFHTFPVNVPEKRIVSLPGDLGGHSELALFYYLQTDAVIDPIIAALQVKLGEGEFRIYGLVLDIFSERAMCGGCQGDSFLRLRKHDALLQQKFVEKLMAKDFTMPKKIRPVPHIYVPDQFNLRFVIRVSSRMATGAPGAPEFNPTYSPESYSYAYPAFGANIDRPEEEGRGIDITRPTAFHPHTLPEEFRNLELFQNSVVLHISPDKHDAYGKELGFMVKHDPVYEGKLAVSKQTVFISRRPGTSEVSFYWDEDLFEKSHLIYSQDGNAEIRYGY